MKNHHTFVDRNFILFKSIVQGDLTNEDIERLNRNGLKSSVLDGAPTWLKVWASLICEYLEFEESQFPEFNRKDYAPSVKLEDIKIDAKNQKETQIQNIAITIDKVMHVLESMDTLEPPIRELRFEEKYNKLWHEPGCLRENIYKVIDEIEVSQGGVYVKQARSILKQCEEHD